MAFTRSLVRRGVNGEESRYIETEESSGCYESILNAMASGVQRPGIVQG